MPRHTLSERAKGSPRWLRLLPLILLSVMVATGLGIEGVLAGRGDGGGVQWWVKLPLVLLLSWVFLARPPSDADSGGEG